LHLTALNHESGCVANPILGFFQVSAKILRLMGDSIHDPAHEAIRALLRKARAEAGLTQAELAKRLGLPQSFVSKYESGERRLDVVELRRVCGVFGLRLEDFVRRWEQSLK
jgi:ribosome-binding protein aMBF1 (putative translation factor)